MNRAARRQVGAVKKTPTYNINRDQLQETIEKEITERVAAVKQVAISQTIKSLTSAFIIGLHDDFGFGPTRLKRLLGKVQLQFECIEEGTVTIEDLVQWCYEYGVDINKEVGKGE